VRLGMVYLAGPITGLTFDTATDWRKQASDELWKSYIKCFSPLRGKEYLAQLEGTISGTGEEYAHLGVLSLPKGVITRDRFDATRCDVLLVNFLGATQVSIGTCFEIAWADAARIPIVCAMEEKGNPHIHMMVLEAIGYKVPTLAEALHIVKAILI
jgi:nucleoside 2-deoxyribosyltransferase